MKEIDRELGEDRPIPRRDFVQGVLTGAATALTGPLLAPPSLAAAEAVRGDIAPQDRRGYYPPRLTGMRGSHPGAFEAAHAVRDGPPLPTNSTAASPTISLSLAPASADFPRRTSIVHSIRARAAS